MVKGEMLSVLHEVEERLPRFLVRPDIWHTLDVLYETPRVERLWTTFGTYRVYLHGIHGCKKPLFHPHPWPSAVRVVEHGYIMGVGYGAGEIEPPEAATLTLAPGSEYEMIQPDGWHYVEVQGSPSLSLMVTGAPWGRTAPGSGKEHGTLTNEVRDGLLHSFKQHYPGYVQPLF